MRFLTATATVLTLVLALGLAPTSALAGNSGGGQSAPATSDEVAKPGDYLEPFGGHNCETASPTS